MIRIALPNKGALSEEAAVLVKAAGIFVLMSFSIVSAVTFSRFLKNILCIGRVFFYAKQ